MVTPISYFNLMDAFAQSGCPVCCLLQRDTEQAIDAMLYEDANDADSHRAFRQGRGLCNTHGWHLTRHAGYSLGTAILYRAALNETLTVMKQQINGQNVARRLLRQKGNRISGSALADALEPVAPCIICQLLSESEPTYLQVFAQYIPDEKFLNAYRTSDGLCLPHFRELLRRFDRLDTDAVQAFIEIQQSIWEELEADLREFQDKNRHERMNEAMGKEADSWQRAIASMGGQPDVFGLHPRPAKRR